MVGEEVFADFEQSPHDFFDAGLSNYPFLTTGPATNRDELFQLFYLATANWNRSGRCTKLLPDS